MPPMIFEERDADKILFVKRLQEQALAEVIYLLSATAISDAYAETPIVCPDNATGLAHYLLHR